MYGIIAQNDVCMIRKEIDGGFTLLVYGRRTFDGIPCCDWVEYMQIYQNGYVHDNLGRSHFVGFDDAREYALQAFERETLRRHPK